MSEPSADAAARPAAGRSSSDRWPAIPVFFGGFLGSGVFFANGLGLVYVAMTASVLVLVVAALALRRTRKRPLAFAFGWLAMPVVAVGAIAWADGSLGDLLLRRSFDAATWREHRTAGSGDRTRFRMVDDLRRSGRLEGRSKEEVLGLLGEPDRRAWGSDPSSWVWRLAPCWIDTWFLRVRFGDDGRVASHDVVTD